MTILGQIKYLTMTDPDKVWMPDTFFQNEKTGHFHNIIVPNVYVRIYPNGKVLYSIRLVKQEKNLLHQLYQTISSENTSIHIEHIDMSQNSKSLEGSPEN